MYVNFKNIVNIYVINILAANCLNFVLDEFCNEVAHLSFKYSNEKEGRIYFPIILLTQVDKYVFINVF